MLTIDEARALVHSSTPTPTASREIAVADAVGRVLAEEIRSDVDLPSFDRSAMDGYAVRAADVRGAPVSLRVLEEVTAGEVASRNVDAGTAVRIMTGAPVPDGADAVVMVEHTELLGADAAGGEHVRVQRSVDKGANIRLQGESLGAGETVLRAGEILRPIDLAILATAGRSTVRVRPRVRCHVLSTGDELVEAGRPVPHGHTLNSNGPMLVAQAIEAGAIAERAPIVRDTPGELEAAIRGGLDKDILLLSGGVSMGTKDHVVEALESCGVEILFHKVAIKPGKPIVVGRRGSTLVFGLPGNPVAVYLGFHLFVRGAIDAMSGRGSGPLPLLKATAAAEFASSRRLMVCSPCRLEVSDEGWKAFPVRYTGSGDIHGAARGSAFVLCPPAPHPVPAGARVEVLPVQSFTPDMLARVPVREAT